MPYEAPTKERRNVTVSENLPTLSSLEFHNIRCNINNLFAEFPALFKILFQERKPVEYHGKYLDALLVGGIVSKSGNIWSSEYSIYEFREKYFLSDSFLLPRTDRVFPISQDESLFLANTLNVRSKDRVLDLGTGTGIYAITAAEQGASVIAVDINEKSLKYARFNASLNGVDREAQFISSNIFSSIGNQQFDLIISNPAIIPTAPGSPFYLHSDGGIDGTKMSFEILKNFPQHLTAKGRLQMLATSFSTISGRMVIEDFIKTHFSNRHYQFTICELYKPCLNKLSSLTDQFVLDENHPAFVNHLASQNYNSLHYLYITADAGLPFAISWIDANERFDINDYNGSWEGRLARLFMVYPKMSAATQ